MTSPSTLTEATEVESAIHAFTGLMEELQDSHKALEERAEFFEAELRVKNEELAGKVSELENLGRHLEAILGALPTGVIERDSSGQITRANDAAAYLLGLKASELVGQTQVSGLPQSRRKASPLPYTRPDGEERVLDLRQRKVMDENGKVTSLLDILEDRTELERITEHLHNQRRMAALGTMAGGIAHEVRNPMNAIRGFASLLERSHGDDEQVERHTRRIITGVDEVDRILSSVLAFANPERLQLEEQDSAECVADALDMVARDTGDQSAWEISSEAESASFVGDGLQLRIALRNLIANAQNAQTQGGAVHISTTATEDELLFQVDDAGPGLDPSLIRRLRDPFFTTRAEGTGLGLALVDTIARLHGGSLEFDSTPSPLGGASFLIRVPRNQRRPR